MRGPFSKLGYSRDKNGSIKPIILTGKPKPMVAPPAPAVRKSYWEIVEAAEKAAQEKTEEKK